MQLTSLDLRGYIDDVNFLEGMTNLKKLVLHVDSPFSMDINHTVDISCIANLLSLMEEKKVLKENAVSTAIDGKVKELPLEELLLEDKASFQGGKYRTVETKEDIVLYRVYGEGAGKQGRFLTTQKPADRMNAKIELALPTKIENGERWTNSRQYFCEVEIPKGTILNIGKCEAQKTAGGETLTFFFRVPKVEQALSKAANVNEERGENVECAI